MDDSASFQLPLILAAMLLVVVNGFAVVSEFFIVKIKATRIEE